MEKIYTMLLLTAAIIGSGTFANAQSTGPKTFEGSMQLQGMFRQSKLGQLNGILNANGIPSLPDNNYWLNLSNLHVFKKFVWEDGIGASFTSTSQANSANGIKAKYNQFQAYGRAGYNVLNEEQMRLFPFIGLNFSAAMLRIRDDRRMQSTADFSSELTNLTASKTLWNPRLGLEFGGGFDYLIAARDKKMDNYVVHRSIPIGVRVGYYLQVTDKDWKADGNYNLNNGPNNKQSNVFINLNIGLGYKVTKP